MHERLQLHDTISVRIVIVKVARKVYTICWSYALHDAHFSIGELTLLGPFPMDYATRIGDRARITLNGTGLVDIGSILAFHLILSILS